METNIFPLEPLTNDNYEDWSVKMKNNLLAQGLWDIVEIGLETPKPDDHVVEYEARRKMNDAALRAIQRSCRKDILDQINNICFAKIAWETLDKMFMENNGKGKQMQIEAHQIIDEGSSSHNPGQEMEDDYAALVKAVQSSDWETARDFLKLHPAASTARITLTGGTVLHAAVEAEQECIVEELVNMISEHDLAMKDKGGSTALHEASNSGNHRMAKCLITKNKSLVSVRYINGQLPVTIAIGFGHKELARYLYSQTPFQDLEVEDRAGRCAGARLLNGSIYKRDLDMALDLMERCPRLAFALDGRLNSPLRVLAISAEAFESENRLVFWKQWIYNHCIHNISLAHAADQFRLNIQNYQEKTIESGIHDNDIISSVGATDQVRLNIKQNNDLEKTIRPGFRRLYKMKLVRAQFQQLLSLMCEAIPTITNPERRYSIIMPLIKLAISRGNFEFVYQILKTNSSFQWICDATEGRHVFHWAVVHRQHRIFSLLYHLKRKNYVLYTLDKSKNTMLHLAGMLPKYSPIDHIRGAALQMQREVQWFKEVEHISPPNHKDYLNKDGLTPNQLFMTQHQNLRKEGEKWMKGTATSCTVVGALIITIMFTAAFTTPGGNNQDTGLPILVHDKLFKLFIVTDSLSLFSSTTSVLMFLGILTSRYADEDFLRSLPRKMIIGLFALFFSIATMMIAFSAALLLMLHGKYWIIVPIIGLAGIPIILFVLMQSRLLIDMLVSTYGSGIFDRKMKPRF
ncbi:uncharacterized protein LOC122293225 isoform X2 [Carya illinoinensis]|uniref:uncharacterized protein LOC122293225 isoform X2 n=1 Tax=Carya illinoinensis TaxID=32201 RepID=UPI001C71FC8B|nr:uncharacterized protein LOC122293225 isoform X2 [Carya illinoinensis]